MGGLAGAWLLAEALTVWREVRASHHMPVPGALLGLTGFYAALGLIGDVSPAARPVVTLGGWALALANLLNALPQGLGGQVQQAAASQEQAQQGTGSTTTTQVA